MDWHLPSTDTYFAPILARTPEGFEIDHLECALQYCKQFRVAIDGGAHIGTWSAYMAKRFDSVIAFEPAEETFDCLVENLKKVRDHKNVLCCKAALGSTVGPCGIEEDPTRIGNTGSFTVNPKGTNAWQFTLDSICRLVDFLKLDIEGHEIEALKGAMIVLTTCRPTVMVELKEFKPRRNGGTVRVVQFLNGLGYREVGGIRNDRVFVCS